MRSSAPIDRALATAASTESTTKPLAPSWTTSGTEPLAQASTGVPQDIASIMARPKGSGQSIGKRSARCVAEEPRLFALAQLADELDVAAEERYDLAREIGLVGRVDLGRDAQPRAGAPRDRDGPVEALLGRYAAEEGEVAAARDRVERTDVGRQAVVYGGEPVHVRRRGALGVGDGHHGHVAELAEKGLQLLGVEPRVQRRHRFAPEAAKQGEVCERLGVKMQHVELVLALQDALQHDEELRQRVAHPVEALGARRTGGEAGAGDRVAARKERHLVAEAHQLLGKIRDHALGAAVELWRNALGERGDLSDLHAGRR